MADVNQAVLEAIRNEISQLTLAEQQKVALIAEKLRVLATDPMGLCTIALIGAELAAQEEPQQ